MLVWMNDDVYLLIHVNLATFLLLQIGIKFSTTIITFVKLRIRLKEPVYKNVIHAPPPLLSPIPVTNKILNWNMFVTKGK